MQPAESRRLLVHGTCLQQRNGRNIKHFALNQPHGNQTAPRKESSRTRITLCLGQSKRKTRLSGGEKKVYIPAYASASSVSASRSSCCSSESAEAADLRIEIDDVLRHGRQLRAVRRPVHRAQMMMPKHCPQCARGGPAVNRSEGSQTNKVGTEEMRTQVYTACSSLIYVSVLIAGADTSYCVCLL